VNSPFPIIPTPFPSVVMSFADALARAPPGGAPGGGPGPGGGGPGGGGPGGGGNSHSGHSLGSSSSGQLVAGSGSSSMFAQEVSAIARLAFQLNTHVTTYRRLVDAIGSNADTRAHRDKVRACRESVTRLAQQCGERLKKLPTGSSQQQEAQREKLARDVRRLLADFEVLARESRTKEARHAPREPAATSVGAGFDADSNVDNEEEERLLAERRQQQQQQQEQFTNLLEHNDAVIAEREEGIRDLQRDIGEVNEIFRDLAVLVHEQDAMIDSIDANIASTETRTGGGLRELERVRFSPLFAC